MVCEIGGESREQSQRSTEEHVQGESSLLRQRSSLMRTEISRGVIN